MSLLLSSESRKKTAAAVFCKCSQRNSIWSSSVESGVKCPPNNTEDGELEWQQMNESIQRMLYHYKRSSMS